MISNNQLSKSEYTVNLKDIPAYCLHHNIFKDRAIKIADMCDKLNVCVTFIESNTVKYSKQQNIAYDLLDLVIAAVSNNIYPFLILEDDATLISDIPYSIEIPKEADLIYWGSNIASGPPILSSHLYISNYNSKYYRLYNSQSSHAILVPNKKSILLFKNILLESLITNNFHDVLLPHASHNNLFLTPKDGPYFYQLDNKNEYITKFKWKYYSYLQTRYENLQK